MLLVTTQNIFLRICYSHLDNILVKINSETEKYDKDQETSPSSIIANNDSTGNIRTKNLRPDTTEIEEVETIPIKSTYDIDLVNDDSIENTTTEAVQIPHTKADVEYTKEKLIHNSNNNSVNKDSIFTSSKDHTKNQILLLSQMMRENVKEFYSL